MMAKTLRFTIPLYPLFCGAGNRTIIRCETYEARPRSPSMPAVCKARLAGVCFLRETVSKCVAIHFEKHSFAVQRTNMKFMRMGLVPAFCAAGLMLAGGSALGAGRQEQAAKAQNSQVSQDRKSTRL